MVSEQARAWQLTQISSYTPEASSLFRMAVLVTFIFSMHVQQQHLHIGWDEHYPIQCQDSYTARF